MTLSFSQITAEPTIASGGVASTTTSFGGEVSKTLDNGISIDASVKQNSFELAEGAPNPASNLRFGVDLSKGFDSIDIGGSVSQLTYTPGEGAETVAGAQSILSYGINGSASFDFGASVNGSFTMKNLSDYTKTTSNLKEPADEEGVRPQVTFKAQGTEQIISGSFKLAPFDFIYGKVTYTQTTRVFDGLTPGELSQSFQSTELDFSTDLSMEIGLSTTF